MKKARKNTVLINWGISYALILLVPLITIFANYYHNTAIIKEEIMQAHELILQNLKDSVDRVMEEEREMFLLFSTKEEFRELVNAEEMDLEFYETVQKFSVQLADYGDSNNGISYWLYMENKDYLVNNGSGGSSRNIYYSQKQYVNGELDFEQWKSLLQDEYSNDFFVCDGFYDNYGKGNLVFANSYHAGKQQRVNIFVSIPVSVIEKLTESLPVGSMLVVCFGDEKENIQEQFLIVGSDGVMKLPETVDITPIIKGKRTFEMTDYVGIAMESENGQTIYSLLVPQATFWNDLRYSRDMHFVGLLITLVVGIGLVYFLLKRNYRPVSGLLELVGSEDSEGDVFQHIKTAYHMMRQENHNMHHTIRIQEKSLLSTQVLAMLKGRISGLGEDGREHEWKQSFREDGIALVGFYIPTDANRTVKDDELAFFIVDNVFSELMETETFYRAEDGRFLYYLFCVPTAQEEHWKEKSLKNVNFLCEFVDEKFGLDILAAISTVEQGLDQVKCIYQNVMEAFEYKRMIGGDGVITTEELQGVLEKEQLHDCHVKLTQALEKGDVQDAHRISRQMFLSTEHTPFMVTRIRVLEAFQIVVDCYNTYITNPSRQKQLLAWLDKLLNAGDRENMRQTFNEMLTFACDKIGAQWETENSGIVKNIREYVEENYTDSSLNVNSIAEKMNRNPVYISKIYKEETGEGILDYLNALRIKKAQELLRSGGVSVEDVGAMVGYATTRTFHRNFTKIVGVTPGNYGGKAE